LPRRIHLQTKKQAPRRPQAVLRYKRRRDASWRARERKRAEMMLRGKGLENDATPEEPGFEPPIPGSLSGILQKRAYAYNAREGKWT
jgi:hypothetical protein